VYCAKCSFCFLFLRLLSGIETDFGLEAEPALSAGKGFAASLPAAGGFDTTERGVEGTGGGRLYIFGHGVIGRKDISIRASLRTGAPSYRDVSLMTGKSRPEGTCD